MMVSCWMLNMINLTTDLKYFFAILCMYLLDCAKNLDSKQFTRSWWDWNVQPQTPELEISSRLNQLCRSYIMYS